MWHWTSTQLAACGLLNEANPYLGSETQRYCFVRDPISRFVSNFVWMRLPSNSLVVWPIRRCGPRNRSRVKEQLECLATVTADELRTHAAAGPARLSPFQPNFGSDLNPEFLVHMQTQRSYISARAGDCQIVFPFDDLRHSSFAALGSSYARTKWEATRQVSASLREKLLAVYADDVQLYERAVARVAPVSGLRPLGEHVADATRRWPRFALEEPACAAPNAKVPGGRRVQHTCSCQPCCGGAAMPHRRLPERQVRGHCVSCFLNRTDCSGLGLQHGAFTMTVTARSADARHTGRESSGQQAGRPRAVRGRGRGGRGRVLGRDDGGGSGDTLGGERRGSLFFAS